MAAGQNPFRQHGRACNGVQWLIPCLKVARVIDVLQDGGLRVEVGRHIDGNVLLARWHEPDGHTQHICTANKAYRRFETIGNQCLTGTSAWADSCAMRPNEWTIVLIADPVWHHTGSMFYYAFHAGKIASDDTRGDAEPEIAPVVISTVLPSRGRYSCQSTLTLPPVRQLYVQLSSNQPLLSFKSCPSIVTAWHNRSQKQAMQS